MGRVNKLIHSSVGNELMHGVVGRTDKLIHCGVVGKVDNLARRRRGGEEPFVCQPLLAQSVLTLAVCVQPLCNLNKVADKFQRMPALFPVQRANLVTLILYCATYYLLRC